MTLIKEQTFNFKKRGGGGSESAVFMRQFLLFFSTLSVLLFSFRIITNVKGIGKIWIHVQVFKPGV